MNKRKQIIIIFDLMSPLLLFVSNSYTKLIHFIKILSNYFIVLQVLIKNDAAVGVEFDFGGRTFQVNARKEVILSAGAIKTPQLLMLSGIGPNKVLETLNVSIENYILYHFNLQRKEIKIHL